MDIEQWLDLLVKKLKEIGVADASWNLDSDRQMATVRVTRANGTEIEHGIEVAATKALKPGNKSRSQRTLRSQQIRMSNEISKIRRKLFADGYDAPDIFVHQSHRLTLDKWLEMLADRLIESGEVAEVQWKYSRLKLFPRVEMQVEDMSGRTHRCEISAMQVISKEDQEALLEQTQRDILNQLSLAVPA